MVTRLSTLNAGSVAGYTGSRGYDGSTGYNGSTGFTGSVGYSGSRGYDGSVGIGYTGSVGSYTLPRVVTLTDATSVTFNADTTDIATQANTQVAGSLTINAPTGTPNNGQKILFRLLSTNVQTFSFNAIFTGSTDLTLPTASTGTSKYDYMGFIYNSTAAKWQILGKNFGF
jgi:hypothetical protein